jgi:hypothetical protein
MTTSYNIAFGKRPKPGFMDMVRSLCEGEKVPLIGAVLAPAPGAWNFGLMFPDTFEDHENFVRQVTIALMPAKYERCDGDPLLVEGEFVTLEE